MPALEITLLGGFQARISQGDVVALPTRKFQALLAYLALPTGRAHPRDKLAALLWGDLGQKQARANLRQGLAALRRALPDTGALRLAGETVALDAVAVTVDARRFEEGVAGPPEGLAASLALYQGDLLAGLTLQEEPFEEWLLAERERLRELALEAAARLLTHQRRLGHTDAAVRTAVRLLALDPLQEPVHRTLMRLYVETGRRGMALRQYQLCVSVLARELRAEPEADTKALYQEILRSRSAVPPAAAEERPQASVGEPAPLPPIDPSATHVPFVGRAVELARLRAMLDDACAGRGGIAGIFGDVGVGKSRLAAEVLDLAAQRGARVLVGHCYETEQRLPFGVWVDAFRNGGVVSDAGVLDSLGPVWRAELARLLPEVGDRAVAPREGGDVMNLYEALIQCVGCLAARRPLVVLLEDWHWVDEMSLRLTPFLARRVRGWPVLVIGTARDEETASRPLHRQIGDQLARERLVVRLRLSPLSHGETLALAQEVLPPGSAVRLAEAVWRASEGNAFMAVEAARALAEHPDREVGDAPALPSPVRHLIEGRLERLSAPARSLVDVAGVIGRQFAFPLLQRAADLPEWEAAGAIEELVRRGIFHQEADGFAFAHDRVRDVAWSGILPPRRALLHRRVAETLEEQAGATSDPPRLAMAVHYREAGVWDKAVRYLRDAGAAAVTRLAKGEAVTCFTQALEAVRHLPESRETRECAWELSFELARELYFAGELVLAEARFRDAAALAGALDDGARLARVEAGLAYLHGARGDHGLAVEAGERALGVAERLADHAFQAWVGIALGRACFAIGDYQRGIERSRQAVDALAAGPYGRWFGGGVMLPTVGARTWLALCLGRLGRYEDALAWAEEAAAIADRDGDARESVWADYVVARIHLGRGHFATGRSLLERAIARAENGRFPNYFPRVLSSLGVACAHGGRAGEALPLLERAADAARSSQSAYGRAMVLTQLGDAYLDAGRLDEAGKVADEALALTGRHGERGDQAWALHLLGGTLARRGERGAALRVLHETLAQAGHLGMRPLAARTHHALGVVHMGSGERSLGTSHLARAVELYRAMGMAHWIDQAEALLEPALSSTREQ